MTLQSPLSHDGIECDPSATTARLPSILSSDEGASSERRRGIFRSMVQRAGVAQASTGAPFLTDDLLLEAERFVRGAEIEYAQEGIALRDVPCVERLSAGERVAYRMVVELLRDLNAYGNCMRHHEAESAGLPGRPGPDGQRSATLRRNIVGKLGWRAANVAEPTPAHELRAVASFEPGQEPDFVAHVGLDDLPADASLSSTLILASCGGAKLRRPAPLWRLYTGSVWQTIRMALGEDRLTLGGATSEISMRVLSGRHGLQPHTFECPPYEQRLDAPTADRLVRAGIGRRTVLNGAAPPWTLLQPPAAAKPWRHVIIIGGHEYRRVLSVYVRQAQELGFIEQDAAVRATHGGIGEQRSQAGRWLRQLTRVAVPPENVPA